MFRTALNHHFNHQKGITLISIIIILMVLAFFVLFSLRLFPLYNEYFGIKTIMENIAGQAPENLRTAKEIRQRFVKNAQINNIPDFDRKTVKNKVFIERSEKNKKDRILRVRYDIENIFFKNIYLKMKINETILLPRPPKS